MIFPFKKKLILQKIYFLKKNPKLKEKINITKNWKIQTNFKKKKSKGNLS